MLRIKFEGAAGATVGLLLMIYFGRVSAIEVRDFTRNRRVADCQFVANAI
jgi:hypothetical protein